MIESFLYYHKALHLDIDDGSYDDNWETLHYVLGDVLDVFLQYGVDPNTTSVTEYDPPLVSAIRFWTAEEVKILLDYGALLNDTEMITALFISESEARFEITRHIFLDRALNLSVTKRLLNGQYPLQAICAVHKASEGLEIVKYFVETGAEVNSRVSTHDHHTALHFAVQHGQLATVRYLIERGAKVRGWLKTPARSLFELCAEKCPKSCGWPSRSWDSERELADRIAIWELLLETRAETFHSWGSISFDFGNSLANAIKAWPNSKLIDVLLGTVTERAEA